MGDVLVTGFGRFPGVERNPSGELLPALAAPGVRTLLLPVEYRGAADVLADALPRLRPDVVLLFGVASSGSVVRVEGMARNHGSVGRPDVSGWAQGDRPLRAGAPATYPATLPVAPLVEAVAASGRPVTASEDAGGYVCNATFFAALHVVATAGLEARCGFVHVPGQAGWPSTEHEAVARICLEPPARCTDAWYFCPQPPRAWVGGGTMDLALIVALGGSALVYLVTALAVATTPMGNVRRAAARGRPAAQREYAGYLGWLITLFFGGPVAIVAVWAFALAWPEPWRAGEGLAWAMLLGLPASAPGALAVGLRLVVELSRASGPVTPRCPIPWTSPHRPA